MSGRGGFFFLIPLFIVVAFAGCTRVDEEGVEIKEGEGGQPRTLRFVTWKPNQPEVWDEALALFHEEHPDIKVVREVAPHSSTEYHDLLTQKLKNRDTSVDVFFMDVVWPPEFAAARWALALDEYFPQEERAKFLEAPILANTYKNHIYGVPFWISSGLLYYRKDLLDKYGLAPPRTWSEMLVQIETVLKHEGAGGSGVGGVVLKGYSGQFKQYEGLVCNMLEFIMSNNGALMDTGTNEALINDPRSIKAVRFVRDNIIGQAAPRGVLTYQEPESLNLFIQGGALFLRNWPYAWEVANNPEKSKVAGKVGIARLPHFEGGRSFSTLGGWQFGINRFSKNPALAWTFIEFMTGPRMQRFFALKAAQPPVRLALYDDAGIIAQNPHFASLRDVFLTSYPRPLVPFYPAVSNVFQKYFSKALSFEDSDIEALALEARREIDVVVKRYTQ